MENTNTDKINKIQVHSRHKASKSLTSLTIAAMMLALAFVFALIVKRIPGMTFQNGGSISIAMVPLVLVAFYCGPIWGAFIGMAFGALDMLLDGGFVWNWESIFLDYIFAFGMAGFAACFRRPFFEKRLWALIAGIVLFGALRFFCHFLSGCLVWTQAATDANYTGFMTMSTPDFTPAGILYSLSYNTGYVLPSIALSIIVLVVLANPIFMTLSSPRVRELYSGELAESDKPVLVDRKKILSLYLIFDLGLSICSTIPYLKISFVGYFSLALSLGLIIYFLFANRKLDSQADKGIDVDWNLIFLALTLIPLVISVIGIVSYYTYGAASYAASFAE
jgi:thiamine transporter